jgi:peptidoglycan/LPS O-acetylase OafA/YrhL
LLKDRITHKWFEIFFYDVTFVYNFFGPPQLATYANAMPLQATGNHFWSICAEEQFYLLAPFLIAIPARIGRSIWFWGAVSIFALASPYWNYFGSISLGVLASVVRLRMGDWQAARPTQIALLIVSIIVLTATYYELIAYWIGAPFSSITIVLLFAQSGRHSRIASFLGGVSYPMYLNHWIGVFVANAVFGKFGLRETLICHLSGVLLSLIAASVLYVAIDRNVRNNRDRYFNSTRGKTVAVCGFSLVAIGLISGLFIMHGR